MADHTFFSTENRHNERSIRILSVGSLVSKPPTKEKRISIKVRMPLSTGGTGTGTMGAPTWLDEAYRYVASHGGDKITPDIEFKGYSIDFSVENLFGDDIKSADCIMRGFEIAEFGNEETPDVVLSFTLRMPFSGKKWNWLGQFVGEDVWAKFIPGDAGTAFVESEDGTLLDDGENEDSDPLTSPILSFNDSKDEDGVDDSELDELDIPEELVYDEPHGKSGPKNLIAFHEKAVEAEEKRGRGRLKNNPVDPLTVNSPSMSF
jgi:hypothetical protein